MQHRNPMSHRIVQLNLSVFDKIIAQRLSQRLFTSGIKRAHIKLTMPCEIVGVYVAPLLMRSLQPVKDTKQYWQFDVDREALDALLGSSSWRWKHESRGRNARGVSWVNREVRIKYNKKKEELILELSWSTMSQYGTLQAHCINDPPIEIPEFTITSKPIGPLLVPMYESLQDMIVCLQEIPQSDEGKWTQDEEIVDADIGKQTIGEIIPNAIESVKSLSKPMQIGEIVLAPLNRWFNKDQLEMLRSFGYED